MTKIASIDIGSNTVRLLILEENADGDFRELDAARRITRLGEGMDLDRRIREPRMKATLNVLAEFRERCRPHGDIPIHAVATSAVREASNREEFLKRAGEEAGLAIEVIPWEEEARLTLEGVFWRLSPARRNLLTFDIGGGSTEFILSRGKTIAGFQSTPLGTVRLTEKFLTRHPVKAEEYGRLETHLRKELASVRRQLPQFNPEMLIGTAGTVTTLAALDQNVHPYDPEIIHGMELPFDRIRRLQETLKALSIEERLALKPLEQGREDLIIAGTAIVLETMRLFECSVLTVSEYGLREGILLKALGHAGTSPAES